MQGGPYGWSRDWVGEEVPGVDQQVVEGEGAGMSALGRGGAGPDDQLMEETPQDLVGDVDEGGIPGQEGVLLGFHDLVLGLAPDGGRPGIAERNDRPESLGAEHLEPIEVVGRSGQVPAESGDPVKSHLELVLGW